MSKLYPLEGQVGQQINEMLTKVSAYRYYGRSFEGLELQVISTLQLQTMLDSVSKQCELGNLEEATAIMRTFAQSLHRGYYHPMNIKRSLLRLMYAFFSVQNRSGEYPYYDIPHFITEQLLRSETWMKTEQIIESFSSYVIHASLPCTKTLSEPLKNALQYVHANYQKPIKLSDVANVVHLNKSYLSQVFQKTMGITYSEYLEQLRVKSAKQLLKTTNKSASEIAEMVGFSSQNYFTKVFKNSVGVSPIRYRNSKTG